MPTDRHRRVASAGAVALGFGLGGLADGILLHQVLGWHHLVSERIPPAPRQALERNLFWDGVFHLAVTVVLLVGLVLLWHGTRHGRRPGAAVVGLVVLGWGGFQLVDQVVFHVLLELHHIRQDVADPRPYDLGYTAIGAALVVLGSGLVRRSRR